MFHVLFKVTESKFKELEHSFESGQVNLMHIVLLCLL